MFAKHCSDHRPVYALADVEILANYVIDISQWKNMRATYMSISNIKLQFFPENFTDAYPDIKLPFEFYMRVYSPGIEDYGESGKQRVAALEPYTSVSAMQPLKFSINDIRYIRAQKLVVAVYKAESNDSHSCISQAVVLLHNARMKRKCLASASLQVNTRFLGGLMFEYELSA